MESRTDKLPKGRSYPLKPSALSSAVDAAKLTLPVELTRWDKFGPCFTARFYPDGAWPGKNDEFFWVSCKAVSSDQAAAVRAVIEREAIPQFIEWARSIEALDARSPVRREKQIFCYAYPKPER
ncbi:MAG TPA: hypothetical protein VF727_01235 [Allosphingosinicella sp.]|jgi:hypothetical protein